MYRLLKIIYLIGILCLMSSGQGQDYYDTLQCRGDGVVLIPRYDPVKQFNEANDAAIEILVDLNTIKKLIK